jgi:hypothetical protein
MESSTGRYLSALPQAEEFPLSGNRRADGFDSTCFRSIMRASLESFEILDITRPAA